MIGALEDFEPGQALRAHRHARPYAAFVYSGGYVETSVDGRFECRAGDIIVHPTYHRHSNEFCAHGGRVRNITLPLAADAAGFRVVRSDAFGALAKLAETAPERAGLAVLEEAETCPPVAPPPWLATFVDLLLSGRRVAASAKACGVTPEHASRIAARWYGDPPSRLIQEDRLRRAVRALLAGRRPADAAAEAGYADQAHLTRALRAEIGLTPAQLPRS